MICALHRSPNYTIYNAIERLGEDDLIPRPVPSHIRAQPPHLTKTLTLRSYAYSFQKKFIGKDII